MNTELENIQQQVSALQENTDLITQDIVRIMPTIVSLLSENEKKMQEFHEMRARIRNYYNRSSNLLKEKTMYYLRSLTIMGHFRM